MNILLTGADGFIGRNLVPALAAAGHVVTTASRRRGIDFRRMHTPADWVPHLAGIDAVINSVGIIGECGTQRFESLHHLAPAALFRACSAAGVGRVVQISALGADASAFSAFHLSKRAADDCLRGLDLDWFALRPSLIYGRGGGSAELLLRLAALPRLPVIGDGRQALQPVHISDVVATVLAALRSPATRQTIDILAGETFTFAEWLGTLRRAQGLPPARLLHIPGSLARVLAGFGRHWNALLQPDALRMLQAGYLADHHPLAQFLGRPPRMAAPHLILSDAITLGSAS